ncbi:unnamed protein product [Vitrella brassicaformis CCMP3155]|uniref:Peptidylprolyl isomerase n=2 Tax=Vitrella brassicaformis TaxID=1169539 RepID=A0A0G4GSP3_VITBC|nr:unnamed protein product [Vitrella brassicaformis CCMP3155]|mmetsp:Transcript_41364/g.103239  ORF Transcript_41364/g.103239 Transcript_41364/m.103239 type:complete len:104 (+) Transcript_41364:82-393(+)|eukprot:CEM33713.1 unnamed protein product [Vitrella brassicaformis CCMP3155]
MAMVSMSNDTKPLLRFPSGAYHTLSREGYGDVATEDHTVKLDIFYFLDGFGKDKAVREQRGVACRVGDRTGWLREAVLSMRVGEVRQIVLGVLFVEVHLLAIL